MSGIECYGISYAAKLAAKLVVMNQVRSKH